MYCACEFMIAKPMNINHRDSHMYHVLYFGVLIWSSFGGVTVYRDIDTYIDTYTEPELTANKKID
jgi:hypothetical protein